MKKKKEFWKASIDEIIHDIEGEENIRTYIQSVLPVDDKGEVKFKFKFSRHGLKRAAQRSLNYKTLLSVLLLGTVFFRQGMTFYTVMEKDIPEYYDHKKAEKLKNIVVVLGDNDDQIVTCYYADNAVRHLKRKSKILW